MNELIRASALFVHTQIAIAIADEQIGVNEAHDAAVLDSLLELASEVVQKQVLKVIDDRNGVLADINAQWSLLQRSAVASAQHAQTSVLSHRAVNKVRLAQHDLPLEAAVAVELLHSLVLAVEHIQVACVVANVHWSVELAALSTMLAKL